MTISRVFSNQLRLRESRALRGRRGFTQLPLLEIVKSNQVEVAESNQLNIAGPGVRAALPGGPAGLAQLREELHAPRRRHLHRRRRQH